MDELFTAHGFSLDALGLPRPSMNLGVLPTLPLYDINSEREQGKHMKDTLNSEQKTDFDSVLEDVQNDDPNSTKLFCDNAFTGSRKTFLFQAILHAVYGLGFLSVPVAWTGIPATLLAEGRTVHSTLNCPFQL